MSEEASNPDATRPCPNPQPDGAPYRTPTVPGYSMVRQIGRGAYGQVWLAHNAVLKTYRAIKVVYRNDFDNPRPFERELEGLRRFEPVSRSHQGLVDILHVAKDETETCFYYVMELGDPLNPGESPSSATYEPRTLAKDLARHGRLPYDEALHLGLAMASALSHLHGQDLIHRDVKPSNIIYVQGTPKLADVGLVTHVDATRSFVGTEGYFPPEGPGTVQGDLYSLGKVLYEIVTGKDREDFPVFPEHLLDVEDAAGLLELNEIALKACQTKPEDRYQSAEAMLEDLQMLQAGKSVRRLRVLEHRFAILKRYGSILVVTLILLGLFYGEVQRRRSEAERARQRQVGAQVAYGTRRMEEGDLLGSLPFFVEASQLDEASATRGPTHKLRIASVLSRCPKVTQMWFLGQRINSVEFNHDGTRILPANWQARFQAFDAQSGIACSAQLGLDIGSESACFSPDGALVATASPDGDVGVWDVNSGTSVWHFPHPACAFTASFSPNGKQLLTACRDGKARIWDLATGKFIRDLIGHTDAVLHGAFSPDGNLVATCGRDETARLWDAASGQPIGHPLVHQSWVFQVAFHPQGSRLATAGFDRRARVWDIPSGRWIGSTPAHGDAVRSVVFSPDGQMLLTASFDGTARLWDGQTGLPTSGSSVLRHGARLTSARFNPDGHRIVTSCIDGTVRIWDLAAGESAPIRLGLSINSDGTRVAAEPVPDSSPTSHSLASALPVGPARGQPRQPVLTADSGLVLVATSSTNTGNPQPTQIRVWDPHLQKFTSPPIPTTNSPKGCALSPDGRLLAIIADTTVRRFEIGSGRELSPPIQHEGPVGTVRFSPDSRRLLSSSGNRVYLCDALSANRLITPITHSPQVSSAEFSPDGALLATCANDHNLTECTAQIWNAATGERVGRPLHHRDGVLHATFSPDSRRILTASEDFTARVWDAQSGHPLTPPLKHDNQVAHGAFSADGRWLATACTDGTARLWDAATGEPICPPLPHQGALARVEFLREGWQVIASLANGRTYLWELGKGIPAESDYPRIVGILCGDPHETIEDTDPTALLTLRQSWTRLHNLHDPSTTTTDKQVELWLLHQVATAERSENWHAAMLHLRTLSSVDPRNPELQAFKDRIEANARKVGVGSLRAP